MSNNSLLTLTARKSIAPTTDQTSTQGALTTDPLPTNLTTSPDTSSQEVIVTVHFTVSAPTNHSNATVATSKATTASELTTPNTTDVVSTTSSTELNNATTEMSTVTAAQLLPTATLQVTTDGVSAFTTLNNTQNTTQSSTLKPTQNSQRLPPGMFKITECL